MFTQIIRLSGDERISKIGQVLTNFTPPVGGQLFGTQCIERLRPTAAVMCMTELFDWSSGDLDL